MWSMDTLTQTAARRDLRKAADLRREASKIDDPVVAERLTRLAERWEKWAETGSGERHWRC